MEKSILKVFKNCQASTATHSQLVTKLINIYLKSDFKKFCDYFIYLMKFNLIHGEKIPAVERTLVFISKFSTSVKSEEKEEEAPVTNSDEDDDVDIDPFLVFVFEFLLENHDAVSKSVRYRVCQLINQILNYMGEQASIDDQLYTKIYDTMLQRLMDRCHNVRVQAILALSRLQDPRNKECPVIKAYLFHLSMDPNPEVRKAVLSNIAITFQTLPDILDRRRDIRDTVRRQAYVILAQKVHIRSFTIAQRIMIISEGLKDRSSLVQQALKKNILQAWLRMVDGNVLELLKCLDVEASKESAELALKHIFENVPYDTLLENFNFLDEKNLIPHEKLSPESALYWICLAKHLKAEKAEDHLEKILPDLKIFCESIREYIQKESSEDEDPQETAVLMMQKDFVCQQLLSMTVFFDMADVVGRKSLCTLVRLLFITPSVSEATIKTLSEVFIHLYPPAERVNELAEIISDIRDPPEADSNASSVAQTTERFDSPKVTKISEDDQRKIKLKLAQISVKMNQNREELEECVRSLNLEKAILLKENLKKLEDEKAKLLEEGITIITPQATPVVPSSQTRMPEEDDEEVKLRNDPETLSRCLLILCEFLVNPDVTVFGSILRSLHDNLILPCLKSEYEGVRRLAVRGLNLCCLLSKELAKQYLLLLIQISKMDVDEIQSEALKGVFDIWLLHGLDEFNSAAEDVSEIEELIEAKGDGTDDEDFEGLEDGQTHTVKNMIPLFAKMLETGNNEARTLTAHGLCKMLMVSQVNSTKLLSKLLLLYYNPENEVDNMLRHMLGVFFPLYASLGGLNQETLGKSLIPTLHIIFNAPARSPLSDIDLDDLVNFLVSLTSPSIVSTSTKATANAHDLMVFSLCAEILAFPDREYTRSLVRNLNHLSLTQTDYTKLKQISSLMNKIVEKVTDKLTLNSAEKFRQFVLNLLLSASKEEDIKNETLGETLSETVQNVTSADLTLETTQNVSQQQRRKRILYSSQTDVELISDLDSENDRSPSKIKRMDQHSSVGDTTAICDSMDVGTTSIRETDDEEEMQEEEKEIRDLKELELSVDNETTKVEETDDENSMKQDEETLGELEITTKEEAPKSTNQSSSDLFESLEGRIALSEDKARKPALISESEDEGSQETHSRDSSCSSFMTASPPRKSPRMQGAELLRSGRKKSEGSRTRSSKIINKIAATPSSSSSFYSTRNSSETPKVSLPKSKRGKSSQEESFADEEEEEEEEDEKVVLDRSLRVKVKKLNVNKYKHSKKKTPRKSEREESTEDDEEEKEEVVLNRSLRVKGNKLNINKKSGTTKTPRKFVDETGSKLTRLSKSDQSSNRIRKSVDSSTRPTRSSKSSSVAAEEENLVIRTRFSSLTVNETPTGSSSSPSGATRSRVKPNPQDGRSASRDRKSASLTRKSRQKPAVTETPSGSSSSGSHSVGPRSSRQKAVSKLLESSLSSSRTTRSSLSSLRDSESTASSPLGSSPASVASSSRSRRMK